jgi:hypothetical protein
MGNLKERNRLEDRGISERISKWLCKKKDGRAWIGSIFLRIRTRRELVYKMRKIS